MNAVKKTVVLIDDHEIVRAGLTTVINLDADLQVIDQQSDASNGLTSLKNYSPDVAVVDINMPGSDSFNMTEQALRANPKLKVLFLTAHPSDSNISRALTSGASGFVSKGDSLTSIVNAIKQVLIGNVPYLSDEIKEKLPNLKHDMSLKDSRRAVLSPREYEVLCCVAQGHTAKEIAKNLAISSKTVERHKSNMMNKLQLRSQVELTKYAIREGLVRA